MSSTKKEKELLSEIKKIQSELFSKNELNDFLARRISILESEKESLESDLNVCNKFIGRTIPMDLTNPRAASSCIFSILKQLPLDEQVSVVTNVSANISKSFRDAQEKLTNDLGYTTKMLNRLSNNMGDICNDAITFEPKG